MKLIPKHAFAHTVFAVAMFLLLIVVYIGLVFNQSIVSAEKKTECLCAHENVCHEVAKGGVYVMMKDTNCIMNKVKLRKLSNE